MVFQLSGVQFCLKSQVWFPTKIARPEVQLPLYYINFEIIHFNWLNTRTTRFWSTPLYNEPLAGLSKSETRNTFTSHFENMSTSCQRHVNVMWLLVNASCDSLFCFTVLLPGKKMRFRAKNSAISVWINRTAESQSDCKDSQWFQLILHISLIPKLVSCKLF